jgi:subtilisin family serine protease
MHVYVTLVLFALAASIAKARGRFLTTEGTQSSVPSQSPSAATTIDAIVGYHNSQGLALIRSVGYNLVDLSVIHAVACKVSPTDYQQLQLDSNIAWIEPDRLVFPTTIHTAAATINDGEVVPYGITLIQGQQELRGGNIFRASTTTLRNTTNSFSCQDPSSMKIGLVDSGYSVGHPDLPCATEVSPNCMGRTFAHSLGLAETAPWFVDDSGHGTHVAGVIGALGDNDVGVVGILPDGDFCFVISRIFGRLGPSPVSTLIQALAWNAEMKTKVINLSLGSPVHSIALDKMVEYLHQSGIIVVAAAGNTANKNESIWPANHPTVISVGAVDKSLHKAPFSAGPTDFVAPGVRILSTTPMGSDGFVYIEIVDGPVVEASYMFGSDPVAGSSFNHKHNQRSFQNIGMMDVAGPLVECPNFGLSICPGPVGHVCIIERGVNYFDQKVDNWYVELNRFRMNRCTRMLVIHTTPSPYIILVKWEAA